MKKTSKQSKQDYINEFFAALRIMESEKGIPAQHIAEKIASAISVAAKHDYNNLDTVYCDIDVEKELFRVYTRKEVVEEVELPEDQMTLDEAKAINPNAKIGDFIERERDTRDFGRIVAQTAKHVIRQGIRDAERGQIM
ncbi:MAG: NusA N-terminal domain-containing protein, partial [Acutalibacteraceae bacterium]